MQVLKGCYYLYQIGLLKSNHSDGQKANKFFDASGCTLQKACEYYEGKLDPFLSEGDEGSEISKDCAKEKVHGAEALALVARHQLHLHEYGR